MPAAVLDERTTTGRAGDVLVDTSPEVTGPLATFPRRIRGSADDGRPWELLTNRTGVALMGDTGRLAEAQVAEEADRVVVDIRAWLHGSEIPDVFRQKAAAIESAGERDKAMVELETRCAFWRRLFDRAPAQPARHASRRDDGTGKYRGSGHRRRARAGRSDLSHAG